jgi:hypothetical protein
MRMNTGRIAAVVRKEFREYRRTPSVIGTVAVLPLAFLIEPSSSSSSSAHRSRPARCRNRWGPRFSCC